MNAEKRNGKRLHISIDSNVLANYTVLVVDDEESVRALVKRLVWDEIGCPVLSAGSGEEALSLLDREKVDIIITDMRMPGLHGFELVRRFHSEWPQIDVMVMTGYAQDFPYVEALNLGVEEFLTKPFVAAELQAKVLHLVNHRESERKRSLAEGKYRSLFDLSAEGMAILSTETYHIQELNLAFAELCGKSQDALTGESIFQIVSENDRHRLEAWLELSQRTAGGTMADLIVPKASGEDACIDFSATFLENETEALVFVALRDVTEKRTVQQDLAVAAERDELTGLFNRRCMQYRLTGAIKQSQENGTPLSLLMIDLDNFKQCNDTHGHQVGDELLVMVGDAITTSIRRLEHDMAFRCGGDEFIVLLPETNSAGARVAAERIQETFNASETYGTSMSIGGALHQEGMSAEEFLGKADGSMYEAKAAEKNTIVGV